MWTQPKFNRSCRSTGIRALVIHHLYAGVHRVTLVRFDCGDHAWWAPGRFIAWPHQVRFVDRIYGVGHWCALGRSSPIDGPRLKAVA